jgi:hypothetical protein
MAPTPAVIEPKLTSATPPSIADGLYTAGLIFRNQRFGKEEVGDQNQGKWHQISGEC